MVGDHCWEPGPGRIDLSEEFEGSRGYPNLLGSLSELPEAHAGLDAFQFLVVQFEAYSLASGSMGSIDRSWFRTFTQGREPRAQLEKGFLKFAKELWTC